MIQWRRLDETNVDQVVAMERLVAVTPWSKEMFLEEIRLGSWQYLLVAESGELVGYVVARPQYDEWHLLTLGVNPACRRLGWGRQLVQGVIDEARRQQSLGVFLEVRISNIAARLLYTGLGFELLARRRGYYPIGPWGAEDALVMGLFFPHFQPKDGGVAGKVLTNPG